MTEASTAPSNAALERMLAEAAEVVIVEAAPYDLDRPGAARITVSGHGIAELARLLAIVDGGTGDRCRCPGWPTIVLLDAAGRERDRWTLHHQTGIRAVGDCDAELRDGPALTDWLAGRGLTGSREVQQELARQRAEEEELAARWVQAAPQALADAAEVTSRREDGAEERLAGLAVRAFPDPVERIRALLTWAGFDARHKTATGGSPWYALAPQRMLLSEATGAIFAALAAAPLTPEQLDGAAELVTCLQWTRPPRAELPQWLRSALIAHVTATGTDPMKFRMRHGYGASAEA